VGHPFSKLFCQLIYVAAIVPDQQGHSILKTSKRIVNKQMKAATQFSFLRGSIYFAPNEAADLFYNMCSSAVKPQAVRHLCYQPIRPYLSRLNWTNTNLGIINKYYIGCTRDKCLSIDFQRSMQSNMDFSKIITLDSDHSPFISMPMKLAEEISGLVD